MFNCDDCVSHDTNYCNEMYHENEMVDDLNSNTECASDKFIIPVNITADKYRRSGTQAILGQHVSETLVPKTALDHDHAISINRCL